LTLLKKKKKKKIKKYKNKICNGVTRENKLKKGTGRDKKERKEGYGENGNN